MNTEENFRNTLKSEFCLPAQVKKGSNCQGNRDLENPKQMEKLKENPIVLKHKEITDKILAAFFKIVYPQLGYGFLEKVYENALAIALTSMGVKVQQQAKIAVYFQDEIVGEYYADLLVNDSVIVEIKAVVRLTNEHEAQLLNYLRATPYEVGLLINFGPTPDFRRKVFDNDRKTITWKTS